MMGALVSREDVVRKTTTAIVLLPSLHKAVLERTRPLGYSVKLAEQSCCQCVKCTDLCSRFVFGHDIEPHKVMRLIGSRGEYLALYSLSLFNCSGCGLCSLVACPFDLSPRRLILEARKLFPKGAKPEIKQPAVRERTELYSVPTERLIKHLGLEAYERENSFIATMPMPRLLRVPCKQHAGVPADPVVKKGDTVEADDIIAKAPEGELSANVHSPAKGKVVGVSDFIEIKTA